jgi:predicted permease
MFQRKRPAGDFNAEIEAHLKIEAERLREEGLSEDEARARALRAFGNVTRAQERFFERGRWIWWDHLRQDVRFGLRTLGKNTGFTAIAVLTLALGIGANTAIFSVIDAVLLRPLPFRDAGRLVLIKEKLPLLSAEPVAMPAPDIVTFQRQSKAFSGVAGFQKTHFELSGAGEPVRVVAARVSSDLFSVLGVAPAVGRTFTREEDRPGSLLAILSYQLWQSRFAGSTDVVGKTVELDRKLYLVIGVMPAQFEFPLIRVAGEAELWVPMGLTPAELSDFGDNFDYSLIARLKPGVSVAQANSDVQSVARGILEGYPASMRGELNLSAVTIPLREAVTGQVRTLLWVLFGAVGFVLLIACANVANLLLARSVGRRREVALRAALGAGRGRLARQFMAESLLLSLAGGGAGLLLAAWCTHVFVALSPAGLPLVNAIGLDTGVLLFAMAASVLAGLLFGTAPALAAYGSNLNLALRESARSVAGGSGQHRARAGLVIVETALALVLMTGAGLLIRTFVRLRATDPGFDTAHLVTMALDLPGAKYQRGQDVLGFYQQLLARLGQLPGVVNVGAGTSFPLVTPNWNHIFTPEGYQPGGRQSARIAWHTLVLGDYFQTLRIPLVRGRYFTDEDRAGALPVVIVSEALAERYWPGQDPIGKRLKWGPPEAKSPWLTVVGVVGDVKLQELGEQMTLHTYEPYLQRPEIWGNGLGRALSVAVRAPGSPSALTSELREAVSGLDRELAVSHLETVDEAVSATLAPQRFNLFLIGAFAMLALVLGSLGLYAVISFSVTERVHEVGIRMALGARRSEVLKLVVGQGLRLTLIGVAFGVAGSLALTRFLASLLYDVKPTDPLTFAAVCALIVLVALAASFIPARRATRLDPLAALRSE